MPSLSTTQVIKDAVVVNVNVVDVDTFVADAYDVAVETFTTTAQSPQVTLSWLTVPMLREIAVDSGIVDPTRYTTKTALVLAIMRAKGLVAYAAPA